MIAVRPSGDRGRTKLDWLDSLHTFSFGAYADRRYPGYRQLRVINEDRVAPGKGFDEHGHRDMEIISYVLSGSLAHRDSTGASAVIRAGEIQRMTAGSGIRHSEYNPSSTEPVHFLQIWIEPERPDLEPGYELRAVAVAERPHRWRIMASREGRDGALTVRQDIELYAIALDPGERVPCPLKHGRHGWVQVARGEIALNNTRLAAGDGAAVSQEEILEATGIAEAEVLLFDLA